MKPKAIVKTAADVLMTTAILALMGRHLWGDAFHEWLGLCAGGLFVAHNMLNREWYAGLLKGRYTPYRVFALCVNVLLLFSMIAVLLSGIAMSKSMFGLPEITGATRLARRLHMVGSYWGFLLVSLHLGLHWDTLIGMAKKRFRGLKPSKSRETALFLIAAAVAAYGAYVFAKRDFLTYMLLGSEFVFLDFGESKPLFYLDYVALMGTGVFAGYYGAKALRAVYNPRNKADEKLSV